MDYRKELLRRKRAYYSEVSKATEADKIKAMANGESVAVDAQAAFIEMDLTHFYNVGIAVDELHKDAQPNYKAFLKAFGLKDPKGKKPSKRFSLPDTLE